MDEFPSNSRTSREPKAAQPISRAEPKPAKLERVTRGEARQRKKPLGKRFRETFVGGDARSVWSYVGLEVLVPAAKDMIADAGREMIERMIFGESRGRGRSFRGTPGHIPYGGYSGGSRQSSPPWRAEPKREVSQWAKSNHDFNEIILESRGEAEQVIDLLLEMISKYNQATLADMYDLVGISSAYTDNKYGWTNLQGANVQHVRGGGYLLNLPKPEPLD